MYLTVKKYALVWSTNKIPWLFPDQGVRKTFGSQSTVFRLFWFSGFAADNEQASAQWLHVDFPHFVGIYFYG